MSDDPSIRYKDFLLEVAAIRPVTHTGVKSPLNSNGVSALTYTIWLGGGGGVWMQAPTQGTSRNSVICLPENSSGSR